MTDEQTSYFECIRCIYDECEPIGHLGRGTHYSIFRSPTWHTEDGKLSHTGYIHDFAVIWDEDHDERVIKVLEALYFEGLLHPIVFAGERKGGITILVSDKFASSRKPGGMQAYMQMVTEVIDRVVDEQFQDYWNTEMGVFNIAPEDQIKPMSGDYLGMLINDRADQVFTYLSNINNLWRLGHKSHLKLKG